MILQLELKSTLLRYGCSDGMASWIFHIIWKDNLKSFEWFKNDKERGTFIYVFYNKENGRDEYGKPYFISELIETYRLEKLNDLGI